MKHKSRDVEIGGDEGCQTGYFGDEFGNVLGAFGDGLGRKVAAEATFNTAAPLHTLVAFGARERLDLGESMQRRVDYWALNGLIQSGAFVDTGCS